MGQLDGVLALIHGKDPTPQNTDNRELNRALSELRALVAKSDDEDLGLKISTLIDVVTQDDVGIKLSTLIDVITQSVFLQDNLEETVKTRLSALQSRLEEIEEDVSGLPKKFPKPQKRPRKWDFVFHYNDGRISSVTAVAKR